jgi:hypothetical protein
VLAFLFFRRFFSVASRGAASRTALRRRGAPQGYDLRPRITNRATDSWARRGAEPSAAARIARRRERSERVPVGAAFCVPFLAGQEGDIPTGPIDRMTTQRRVLNRYVRQTT